jgi:RNA polymerase sigma factor (TIGR02999 family)
MAEAINLSELWSGFSRGETRARDQLLSIYYNEFRMIARRILKGDSGRMHVQPTDLVHEAAIRIIHSNGITINDQNHFLALAARVMRSTLIDEVRRHKAAKRGGEVVTLWTDFAEQAPPLEIEAFDGLLYELAKVDEESAHLVELRFYVGLTISEIATTLSISESTANRRWRTARAWLLKELQAAA